MNDTEALVNKTAEKVIKAHRWDMLILLGVFFSLLIFLIFCIAVGLYFTLQFKVQIGSAYDILSIFGIKNSFKVF